VAGPLRHPSSRDPAVTTAPPWPPSAPSDVLAAGITPIDDADQRDIPSCRSRPTLSPFWTRRPQFHTEDYLPLSGKTLMDTPGRPRQWRMNRSATGRSRHAQRSHAASAAAPSIATTTPRIKSGRCVIIDSSCTNCRGFMIRVGRVA
jgi:hypothetical protein